MNSKDIALAAATAAAVLKTDTNAIMVYMVQQKAPVTGRLLRKHALALPPGHDTYQRTMRAVKKLLAEQRIMGWQHPKKTGEERATWIYWVPGQVPDPRPAVNPVPEPRKEIVASNVPATLAGSLIVRRTDLWALCDALLSGSGNLSPEAEKLLKEVGLL